MSAIRLAFAALLGISIGTLQSAPIPRTDASPEKIQKLVEQLGSKVFRQREAASKELDSIGEPALTLLKKALQSPDEEVRVRAKDLVNKIENRVEIQRVLAPTYVHLKFQDTPLSEAIKEFSKQAKFPIQWMPGNKTQEPEPRITLDTGKVPFWEAMEQFCEKANVSSLRSSAMGSVRGSFDSDNPFVRNPQLRQAPIQGFPIQAPALPVQIKEGKEEKKEAVKEEKKEAKVETKDSPAKQAKATEKSEEKKEKTVEKKEEKKVEGKVVEKNEIPLPREMPIIQLPQGIARQQAMQMVMEMQSRNTPSMLSMLFVTDAPYEKVPTHVEKSIRIQVVPNAIPVQPKIPEGELFFGYLRLQSEPKISIQRILNWKIDKALDDRDQQLALSDVDIRQRQFPFKDPRQLGNPNIPFERVPTFTAQLLSTSLYPVMMKKGQQDSKQLKELSGTVSMLIRSQSQVLAKIDNPLQASKEFVSGKGSSELRIMKSKQVENGDFQVQIELNLSSDVNPTAKILMLPSNPKDRRDGRNDRGFNTDFRPTTVSNYGLELFDAKQTPIEFVSSSVVQYSAASGMTKLQMLLVYRPKEGQGEPARLTFNGSIPLTVEVPFTLKNLPLVTPPK